MTQPKLVSIDFSAKQESPLSPILNTVCKRAEEQLNALVQSLFNNIDDALFEMADRSHSDKDQTVYFDSMRVIRLRREAIGSQFIAKFKHGFGQAFQPARPDENEEEFEEFLDDISLVDNDDLEVSVAVTTIVSKVTGLFPLPIMRLTRRFDHLSDTVGISEAANPLGPRLLSQSFVASIECLDVDMKMKLIILKLFERFVMERLGPIFDEANTLLANAGVLPDLERKFRQTRNRRETRDFEPVTTTGDHAPPSGYEFNTIQTLLASVRGSTHTTAIEGGSVISTERLLSALSAAQSNAVERPIDIEAVPRLLDLRQIVGIRSSDAGGGDETNMGQADEDVVNFVGMLFDYILNDRNLAIPMKALIARLQIPIVRLAIVDKTFFQRTSHPARRLLNELSSAGIGWSNAAELKRDAMYNKLESIVLQILNGFADDARLFEALAAELRAFVKIDQKRRTLVERRVRESEQGKAIAAAAKETVERLISRKTTGMSIPPVVRRFIIDTFARILVYTHVNHGEASDEWQSMVQVLDDLLWCLHPMTKAADVNKRNALVARLSGQLSFGMKSINVTRTVHDEQLECLETQLRQITENDRVCLEDDKRQDDTCPTSFEELDEIELTEPIDSFANMETVAVEPEYLKPIEGLEEGSWVEMKQDGAWLRCKLSTIVQPGDHYVFVNRRGMKVAEKTRTGLAVELKRKSLRVLDESFVFDRALRAVIGKLRKIQGIEPLSGTTP
ncbi:MAG: DUF1631 domain-containing protein [Gammaproteobacteria bacterium]|nr:DUF1631 domain-containing protein [Gammaproteobacteria bacterium]